MVRSPDAALRFYNEVERGVALIAEAPARWPTYLAGTRRVVLRQFPYSLVYLAKEPLPLIVAVAHHKRRPRYWEPRLGGAA